MAIVFVGIDLAKNVFAVHGVDEHGKPALVKPAVARAKLLELIVSLPPFKQFKNGAQFGAWLGLVPKQHSSGGKPHLGTITKRGDPYLRTLLIQGAKSVVNTAHMRNDPISRWAAALKERSGWQKAVVALANKNARILWAVMARDQAFDAHHVSVKPG